MKFLSLVILVTLVITISFVQHVFAAENKLEASFDPPSANFTAGEQSVVYLTLQASNDSISAATIHVSVASGIKITDILSPVDTSNIPISDTKLVNKKVSDTSASATVLLMKNTADLPSTIKIPIIVTNGKNIVGKLILNTSKTEVVNATGNAFAFTAPKEATISFSQVGQINNPAPSPTPLPKNSMVLQISTKLHGVQGVTVKRKTLENVQVQLVPKNGAKSIPAFMKLTLADNDIWQGTVVIPNISPGNYQVLIKGPYHLQRKICDATPSEESLGKYSCNTFTVPLTSGQNELDFSGISLLVGDIGLQDATLNAYDLVFVQNVIRKKSKTSVKEADVNLDGKVDKKDYDLFVYSLVNTSGLDQK